MAINPIVKGAAVGLAVGTATFMMTNVKKRKAKMIKQRTGKAIRAVGTVIEDLSHMIR